MRILLLTPFLPNPAASHGGGSYIGALAEGLSKDSSLGLIHVSHPGEGEASRVCWQWLGSAPYDGSPNGAIHRMKMLWRWRSRPLLAAKYWQPALIREIERARREFQPDVALIELAQMAQYLPALEGIPTILTDHEAGRPINSATGLGTLADRRDHRLWDQYVADYFPKAKMLQAVTAEDAAELRLKTGCDVQVRAPTLPIPERPADPSKAPRCALFLGDYRHQPNPEAARRIAEEIWPLVRAEQPDACLILAGAHEAPIRHLGQLPGVEVTGYVDSLEQLMGRARVLLSPLWSGRGFRVKNAMALTYGVPIVTNELGSRGCRAPSPACTVAESPNDLARAALQHLASSDHAAEAGRAARSWAVQNYDAQAVTRLQLQRARDLLA